MRKILFLIIAFSLLTLSGCTTSPKSPSISVTPALYDFGDIIQNKGPVSATFIVKNEGREPLEINRLSTSCGCTTATMEKSPIEPNENREMTVSFDPMVHPDQFGKIERVVYLQTSDPENPEVEINIIGNVIK